MDLVKGISIALSVVLLTGCAAWFGESERRGVSSSLVDYLYPDGEVPPEHEEVIPQLQLPITVGLAFVPSRNNTSVVLPEMKKNELLEKVRQQFLELDYVQDIVVVPETYLRSSRGFEGVEQIARLYGLDVMGLVSYDQVAMTSERNRALLYWTIVGAYTIKGNENQVSTFVDTAVFDVRSQKMLFRAPGVNEIERSSTLVRARQVNREARTEGFELAMTDMTTNLEIELDRFKDRIRADQSVQITRAPGYGGSGAIEWPLLLLVMALALVKIVRR
mgnify:CR=1 FL=1